MAPAPGPSAGDPGYAWQHGLYWLASNLAADAPLALVVDDLQWCDAPSASALAFIARRLEGQPLALILATRPLDPALTPEAAALVGDPAAELLRPSPLTQAAVGALVAARLSGEPDDRFVRACLEVTGGNPFLLGELLDEAAARGLEPTAAAAAEVGAIVPRGVANAVLLRLARHGAGGRRARPRAQRARRRRAGRRRRAAGGTRAAPTSRRRWRRSSPPGVVESGATVRFTHPILRAAIYGDLSPAERERLHRAAATILRERGAPAGQVAAQVMHTEPAADPEAVGAAAGRRPRRAGPGRRRRRGRTAVPRPRRAPADGDRAAVLLELGQAHARAGAPEAIAPLTEIIERGDDAAAIAAAAIELSGMLFFAGRAAEGAAILRRAQERLPAGEPAREQLEVALLGVSSTSASARREADGDDRRPARPGRPGTRRAAGHDARHARDGRGAVPGLGVRPRPTSPSARSRRASRSSPTAARTGRTWPWPPSGSRTVSTRPCGAPTRSSRERASAARHSRS